MEFLILIIGVFCENYIPPIRKEAKKFMINLSKNYIIKLFTTKNKNLAYKQVIENDIDNYITDVTNIKENCFVNIDDRCKNSSVIFQDYRKI